MTPGLLCAILLLDLCLGDPRGWPHPIVWIGHLVSRLERHLRNELKNQVAAGIVLVLSVLAITGFCALMVLYVAATFAGWLAWLVALWMGWNCLALRSLHRESSQVIRALERGDLNDARQSLAMIVGRDTAQLDEQGVLKACLETVAENTSDGVVAPLFYLLLGGPILALLYKAVNTLDSMVGYKSDTYREFGWAAARLDDLLNWIPSRFTALLLVAASFLLGLDGVAAWRTMWRDAGKHASPNAGWPEAAVAGALGVQLGGAAYYFGERVEKATFGDGTGTVTTDHYRLLVRLLYASTLIAGLLGLLLLWVLG